MHTATLRQRIGDWIESMPVQKLIILVIVVNAITLGLETSPRLMADYGTWLTLADRMALTIFVVEIGLKLFAFRLDFFRSAWNVFDFIIVGIALIPASGPLAVLRALRVFRVLRLISMLPRLRFVVEALLHAIPGITSIAGLMVIIFYVFSVMATSLFGTHYTEWFGSVAASMYTLFQIMTLESWSMGIVRPVMESHPHAWLFFVPFILIATFTMLNLFIAVIVDTMQTLHSEEHREELEHIEHTVQEEGDQMEIQIAALRDEIRALRAELGAGRKD